MTCLCRLRKQRARVTCQRDGVPAWIKVDGVLTWVAWVPYQSE